MRRIAVLSLALVLTLVGALSTSASGDDGAVARVKAKPAGCAKVYGPGDYKRFAESRAFAGGDRATRFERRTLNRVIRCQRRQSDRKQLRRQRVQDGREHRLRNYWRWRAAAVPAWLRGVLETIASCESGGDPTAIGGGGLYRGKYQFDYGTWASVGGSGDPAAASEFEQDVRAALLYRSRGAQPWPVCGV